METRPRCEAFDDGALVNLRGRSRETLDVVGPVGLGSDLGDQGPGLFGDAQAAATRSPSVEKEVEAGRVVDPGDLIAAFATAITSDLDPAGR